MLRDYQIKLAEEGLKILSKYNLLYLAMEMRVGKTLIALETARLLFESKATDKKFNKILVLTKKKIINSIKDQIKSYLGSIKHPDKYIITVANYESAHKLNFDCDVLICDEAHTLGSFPKPCKAVKVIKQKLINKYVRIIYLSGTPSPESYSQLYHQFYISSFTPFKEANFYKWANSGFVLTKQRMFNGYTITDYSNANKSMVDRACRHLFLSFTQKQAGFKVETLEDEIKIIPMPDPLKKLIDLLLENRVYVFKDKSKLVCDTAIKLQHKIHQISSGTVITDYDSNDSRKSEYKELSSYKAEYISANYKNKKIAIFYLYVSEGEILKKMFNCTSDPNIFNSTDSNTVFISQFQSGSRGINLSSAEIIIFYNISFSSELYQQSRQRAQEKDKATVTKLHWLFSDYGIEQRIYSRVINKQSYTLSYFVKDYLLK